MLISYEEALKWQIESDLITAWDRGYHDAMSFALKAAAGIPLTSPTNPYDRKPS